MLHENTVNFKSRVVSKKSLHVKILSQFGGTQMYSAVHLSEIVLKQTNCFKMQEILVQKYLSEKEHLIHTAIKENPNNAIIAGCGLGKSAMCFGKEHAKPFYQTYSEKEGDKHYTVYIATTKLKIKMDVREYPHITPFFGEMGMSEVERKMQIKNSAEKVLITTYGYVQKAVKY